MYMYILSCSVMSSSFEAPWTAAHQAPLSMGFSSKNTGVPFPSPGDLPDPGVKPRSPTLQADTLPVELQGNPCAGSNLAPRVLLGSDSNLQVI